MHKNNTELIQSVTVAVILAALIVTVIGVLALPITLSIAYTWWWMFMYPAYFISALIIAYGFRQTQNKERSINNNENNSAHR